MISVGGITEIGGIHITFYNTYCLICDYKKSIIAKGVLEGQLYQLQGTSTNSGDKKSHSLLSVEEDMQLEHKRYEHLNVKSLKMLKTHNMVIGWAKIRELISLCEVFQKWKQARLKFPKRVSIRAEGTLDLLHVDLVGPL